MGQSILRLAKDDNTFKVCTLLEHQNHATIDQSLDGIKISSDPESLKGCEVLIEFTTPEATLLHLRSCLKYNVKMVIGTTGLIENQVKEIEEASKKIPIVFSSNMSVGVNILFSLARQAASKTAGNYTVKIVEAHHIHKKDAPSGTAKTLAQVVEDATKIKVSDIQSIREGEIIGDHDVIFESEVDTIALRHHAKTRDIFAEGSLVAAKFVSKKKNGLFNMQDVLGIK